MDHRPRTQAVNRARASRKRDIAILPALALLPSWLGLLGGWHWALDLLAHFRWQYGIASVLVLAWAVWSRRRVLATLAALTLLLNAALIGQLAWTAHIDDEVANDFSMRVVAFNVLTSNPDKQRALDYLLATDADVIGLVEVDQTWLEAMVPLQAKYPYQFAEPRPDNFGVALFSRIPLERAELLWLGEPQLPSIEASMWHQGRHLSVIVTHPMPPMGARNAALRDGQLARLADHVSQLQMPVLVVGDLNVTPWSAGMRILTARGLGLRSLRPPWTPTWRATSVFAVPIDHALSTAPLVITSRSVGPDLGSDHRPLDFTVGWSR
jgi:endonuclease/exonuclease/phosphatase (EEP) superfamily protein YafD